MIRLDELFRAYQEIDLPDGRKGMVRALTDVEQQERRRWAILQGLKVERELRNKKSTRYQEQIAPLAKEETPTLVNIILQVRRLEVEEEAYMMYPNVMVPIPDNANVDDEAEVLDIRQQREAETAKNRTTHIAQRMTEIRKKLEADTRRALVNGSQAAAVKVGGAAIRITAMRWYTVFAGSYVYENQKELADPKRLFESPEQVMQLSRSVIDRLVEKVEEVNQFDVWALQKN